MFNFDEVTSDALVLDPTTQLESDITPIYVVDQDTRQFSKIHKVQGVDEFVDYMAS